MDTVDTRYANAGDLSIAYSVGGEGPPDILICSNWTSHVEAWQHWSSHASFIYRLQTLGRLILFDLPGNGLSDPVSLSELPTLEQWMDYVRLVMDAAGSERAVLLGVGAAGGLAIPFAATHPDRVAGLVLYDSFARVHTADDYPFGVPSEKRDAGVAWWLERWGTGRQLELTAPDAARDPHEIAQAARFERYSASPGVIRAFFDLIADIDVREILPAVRVPTLVLHRSRDRWIRVEHGRYLAERIEGSRYVELPGDAHFPWYGDMDGVVAELRTFVASLPEPQSVDRMLATIVFTDIVDSTARAAELGDHRWRELLDRHDEIVREQLTRWRGRQVRSTGDGFLATFDGAARAVRWAEAVHDALRPLGLSIRAGAHTGEIEARGDDVHGIAVHLAARVAALAGAGEVLVSQTVKDLTIGAGIHYEPRGAHTLKGVPGEWSVFAADGAGAGSTR
jgi:pimeloyl-ACP methyl ester carboxylesterase/class 3 adenylate cyclase